MKKTEEKSMNYGIAITRKSRRSNKNSAPECRIKRPWNFFFTHKSKHKRLQIKAVIFVSDFWFLVLAYTHKSPTGHYKTAGK